MRRGLCALIAVLILGVPGIARADSVTITSGVMTSNAISGNITPFNIEGTDGVRSFSFSGSDTDDTGQHPSLFNAVLNVALNLIAAHGQLTYGGQTYPVGSCCDSDTEGLMRLTVQGSAPFSAPAAGIPYTALVPFTIVGSVVPPQHGTWLPGPLLMGSGVAHVLVDVGLTPTAGVATRADYVFGEELPAPAPEPATVLLCATGLVQLAIKRRRARGRCVQ